MPSQHRLRQERKGLAGKQIATSYSRLAGRLSDRMELSPPSSAPSWPQCYTEHPKFWLREEAFFSLSNFHHNTTPLETPYLPDSSTFLHSTVFLQQLALLTRKALPQISPKKFGLSSENLPNSNGSSVSVTTTQLPVTMTDQQGN
jgi:hypothetical protein